MIVQGCNYRSCGKKPECCRLLYCHCSLQFIHFKKLLDKGILGWGLVFLLLFVCFEFVMCGILFGFVFFPIDY